MLTKTTKGIIFFPEHNLTIYLVKQWKITEKFRFLKTEFIKDYRPMVYHRDFPMGIFRYLK